MSLSRHYKRKTLNPFALSLSMLWIRGVLYIVAILIAWYFVEPILPTLMELTGNRNSVITFVIFAIFAPLIGGWLGSNVVNRLARRWNEVDGVARWEDRIVEELAPDRGCGFPIVLVPWPSEEVKTFAVLADVYRPSHGNGELASVYIPGTPDPSNGFLRVVPADKLVYVDWALKDLLQYHLSFGATGPPLHAEPDGADSEL